MKKIHIFDVWAKPLHNGSLSPLKLTGDQMVDDISKLLREKKMLYIWDVERHLHKGNAYINAVMDYVTGMSFKEWTRQIHLRDAQWLLLHTDLPLKKIAGIVGFSSASALGAFIKSCMKVSPSELRKQAFYS